MSRLLSIAAALALVALTAIPTVSAVAASKSAQTSARIFTPTQIGTVTNLSTGFAKTQGNTASGTITMPATFPLFATPIPTYTGGWSKNGANADPGTAARVDLTGEPNAGFAIIVSSWTHISGDASTVASSTFYSPSGSPTNSANGVFNAQGKATIYIGATVTIPRDPNGTTVIKKPVFTVVYN